MSLSSKMLGRAKSIWSVHQWKKFGRQVRAHRTDLLSELDKFDKPILVAGCQRSGTTALSRILTASDGMVNYWFGADDELDAALILAGVVAHSPRGRYCFQTTYLNECYVEYFRHEGKFKLIWLVRNPFSVVYSMLNNWSRFALNELFESCGLALADDSTKQKHRKMGNLAIPSVQKACLAYNGKTSQLFELLNNLDTDHILVVDYDRLVEDPAKILPDIYDFVDLAFKREYCRTISGDSQSKATQLSPADRSTIERMCLPIYNRAKTYHYAFDKNR